MHRPLILIFLFLFILLAARESLAGEEKFSWGGDLRARLVDFNRIPTEQGPMLPETRFFRFRTRVWANYAFTPDVSFKARLVNAWREYDSDKGTNRYQAMDEFVFDNFYLDINNLFQDRLDLRLGRQDLKYGTGKIIRIGTPLDSSRTYYFNAVKGRLKFPRLQIDLFAIFNDDEDAFAIHRANRLLVEGEENGAGIYIINKRLTNMVQEYYYIFKHEVRSSNLDLHTVGGRFTRTFNDRFSANLELAIQDGKRDNGNSIGGQLFDLSLFYKLPFFEQLKAKADLSYYYLSGDDPNSSREEGWHAVWSRYPQYMSYTVVRALVPDFASWSNISMPSMGISSQISDHLLLKCRLARVYAPEEGPGGSKEKGSLFISRLTYKINEKWDGNLHFEVMDPDSYYENINHYAHYAHVQLMYHF